MITEASDRLIRILRCEAEYPTSVDWSPDSTRLAIGTVEGIEVLTAEGQQRWRQTAESDDYNLGVSWSPDGRWIATAGCNLSLWNAASGQMQLSLDTPSEVGSSFNPISWHPNSQRLAYCCNTQIYIVDLTGETILEFEEQSEYINSISWSPDGRWLASDSSSNSLRVWNSQTGTCQNVLTGHTSWIGNVCWSPDGKTLASGSEDGTIRIWDAKTGQCLRRFNANRTLYALSWAPDSQLLASKTNDTTVQLWTVNSVTELLQLYPQTDSEEYEAVFSDDLAFSPDGTCLACISYHESDYGDEDHAAVHLWDVSDLVQPRSLEAICRKIRNTYANNNPYLAFCHWFDTFDRHVYHGNFEVCEGLLQEIRDEQYPLSAREWLYVESREGVLWLRRGIEHHKHRQFENAQDCYQQSLAMQQKVRCREAAADVELFRSSLEKDVLKNEPDLTLDALAQELRVLGGSEQLLSDRLATAPLEEHPEILLAAVEARLVKPLVQAVKHSDARIRMMAIAGLGRFQNIHQLEVRLKEQTIQVIQVLIDGLRDPHWFVRWRAAEALAQPDLSLDEVATDSLMKMAREVLEREPSPDVKQILAKILIQSRDSHAVAALVATLADPDADVRIAAIEALREVSDSAAFETLPRMRDGKGLFGSSVRESWQKLIEAMGVNAEESLRAGQPLLTLIVAQNGEGEYRSIREAVVQALPGTRILVRPGRYQEGIAIDKPLEIVGEGSVAEIVIESTDSDCILMKTNYAAVSGLTIHGCAEKHYGVNIPQGELLLTNCDITSDSFSCVFIQGTTAQPIIRHCKIHDSGMNGICIYQQGQGTVEDCDIFGNSYPGIALVKGGSSLIRRCKIHDGRSGGVLVQENSQSVVEDCDIFANRLAEVAIEEKGNPAIRNCKIHHGQGNGIRIFKQGEGTIEGCDIFANTLAGVEIAEAGNPSIRNCKIHDGQSWGIYIHENGRGIVEKCDIFANTFSGVGVHVRANSTIRNCRIQESDNALGYQYHNQGKYEAAIASFQKAIEANPDLPNSYTELGNVYRIQGEYEAAIASFQKAIELNPDLPYPHIELGRVYRIQGQYEAAIACCYRAIDLDPDGGKAYSLLGYILLLAGSLEEAETQLKKARELLPGNYNPLFNLGSLAALQGQLENARRFWQQGIQLCQGNDVFARLQQLVFSIALGEVEDNLVQLRELLETEQPPLGFLHIHLEIEVLAKCPVEIPGVAEVITILNQAIQDRS